ncbi:MAG: LptF/LptG family permease [Verrucomicrobiota bacterium]
MRLLDRYLTKELLIPLSYCLVGFLIFWIAFDWLGTAEDFQDANMGFGDILSYYWIKIPEFLSTILPITLLLAMLYALTQLARYNELIAMRAAGVSWFRLCAPYFTVGILLSLLLFLINETWGTQSANASAALMQRHQEGGANAYDYAWHDQATFRNLRDGRTWIAKRYNTETSEMRGVYVTDNSSDLQQYKIEAKSAIWTNSMWVFHDVNEIYVEPTNDDDGIENRTSKILEKPEYTETPEQFKSELKISMLSSVKMAKQAQLSLSEISHYYALHPEIPKEMRPKLATQYHGRIAWPWTCLVVVLIAIPFGAPSGRRNVFAGVSMSIFFCFTYFILMRLGLALGTRGTFSPWLAAWFPNVIFGGTSIWFIRKIR